MASGRIQPGSRQWVEAMRRLSGTEDTTVDMSMGRKVSRDAAIPHGMGTATLDTRLRGAGAFVPVDLITPAVLALSEDEDALTYTQGVWSGVPEPVITGNLNVVGGPSGISVQPGPIPIDDAWRGRRVSILEGATNDGGATGMQQVSNSLVVPAFPALDADVRAIVEGRGFVFDPSDLSTLRDSTGGPITGPDLIGRINGKWGAGTENLSLQSPFPSLTAESDLSFLRGLGFAGFNFRGGDAYCVTLGFRVPALNAGTLLYRRERGSGNEMLDVVLNPDGTVTVLIAGSDQQRANSVTITTTDRVQPGEFFSITALANFTANTAEVWLNGVSQGTGTFSSAAGPATSMTQTWVVLYAIEQTLFRRVVEYAGLPTADERDLFERWVTQSAGVGRSLSDKVQAIIGTTAGFAFDPFDFATNLTTGNVPATALGQPILRQNAKWGSAPGFFSGGGVRPVIEAQGLINPVSATTNPTTNADAILRGFFRNRSAIFICQAMQVPRRPASRAHAIACSQVSGALGRLTLHTDYDLSVTFNYRRTDLGDGAGKVELPPNTLVPGERTVVSCAVDFANGGARIWKDGVLGDSSAVPAAGGNLEDTLPTRVRSGAFVAGGVNEFFEGGLGRAVYLPFIPTAAQQKVIEAWAAEPPEVELPTVANPTLTERVQAILRQTKGFALDPQDLTLLWQDDEAITPVTAPGQPVGAIRSKFGNTSYTYRAADPIVTAYEGGAISFDGADGGLINPSDNFTTSNTGMLVVARVAAVAGQQDDAPVVAFLGVGGGTRMALELKSDLRPAFSVARPDANELQITGTAPLTPGQAHTLSVRALFLGAPAPVQGFLDGVLAAEGVLTGTPAVTDAPVAPYGGLGQWGDTALQFSGYVGRVVCAHFFQTDKDRQVFEAWVAEGPWPAVPPG
jgi:hypothetical protein